MYETVPGPPSSSFHIPLAPEKQPLEVRKRDGIIDSRMYGSVKMNPRPYQLIQASSSRSPFPSPGESKTFLSSRICRRRRGDNVWAYKTFFGQWIWNKGLHEKKYITLFRAWHAFSFVDEVTPSLPLRRYVQCGANGLSPTFQSPNLCIRTWMPGRINFIIIFITVFNFSLRRAWGMVKVFLSHSTFLAPVVVVRRREKLF